MRVPESDILRARLDAVRPELNEDEVLKADVPSVEHPDHGICIGPHLPVPVEARLVRVGRSARRTGRHFCIANDDVELARRPPAVDLDDDLAHKATDNGCLLAFSGPREEFPERRYGASQLDMEGDRIFETEYFDRWEE